MENLVRDSLLTFYNICLIAILILCTKSALSGKIFSKSKTRIIFILCWIFCIFSFWGADWFGFLKYFLWIKGNNDPANINMEVFYIWLMTFSNDYLLFRGIVWGVSLFFFAKTLDNLNINKSLALFFFCSIYLIYFSYARATLAISMMCYGYSCLWANKSFKKITNNIWGIAWIALSFFFLKSAILGIGSIVSAILLLKFGTQAFKLLIICIPFMILLMNVFFQDHLSQILSEDNTLADYANASTYYLDEKKGKLGISTVISWLLERTPYYLLAYLSLKELTKPTLRYPDSIKAFIALELIIVVLASIFLFDYGVNTSTIYGRFMRFAQIPSVIILTYFYSRSVAAPLVRWTYRIGIAGCLYSLVYSFYDSL